jgi:glycosyltransferase involved in cell wall biosynthesis
MYLEHAGLAIMLPTKISPANELSPFVSVIIPYYGRDPRLLDALAALSMQSYPQQAYEVIVVVNQDAAPEWLNPQHVRIAFESSPGSYAARNCGVRIAAGEIVAFTDADCIPDENWLRAGVDELLAHPDCAFVAGDINIKYRTAHSPTPVERYDRLFNLRQKEYVKAHGFGATANLFAFKGTFQSVGLFNSCLFSGGDHEWCRRATTNGLRGYFSAKAVVDHPARRSFRELIRKDLRIVGGMAMRMKLSEPAQESILNLLDNEFLDCRWRLQGILAAKLGRCTAILCCYAVLALPFRFVERIRVRNGGTPRRH